MNKTYTVGEKVFLVRYYGHHAEYAEGSVSKVTPSGIVEVTTNGGHSRFNAKGKLIGGYKWDSLQIDAMPFEARIEQKAKEKRQFEAFKLIQAIKVDATQYYGKDALLEEVVRLQALLDAAKAAVEAI